jgi:hypothetical protein
MTPLLYRKNKKHAQKRVQLIDNLPIGVILWKFITN